MFDRRKRSAASKPTEARLGRTQRLSAQRSINYEAMAPDGLCQVTATTWSLTFSLSEVSYQVAAEEIQADIVEKFARFLNFFGSDTRVQLTIVNRRLDASAVAAAVSMQPTGDPLDRYRVEFNQIVEEKLSAGRSNIVTDKYLTIGVSAPDEDTARTVLGRLAVEVPANLRSVHNCEAVQLTGTERLELLHTVLRPNESFLFDYDMLSTRGATTKDFVVPAAIELPNPSTLVFRDNTTTWHRVLWLRDLPPWLSDRLLKELMEVRAAITISVHHHPLDHADGLAMVKHQIAGMEMQVRNEQRKAQKAGYGADMISHELTASHEEALALREQLEKSNERLFQTTVVVGVSASSAEDLDERVKQVIGVARKHSSGLAVLGHMQEAGLSSELPLGQSFLPIHRTLTTATAAILIPFTISELFHNRGLYYGVNQLSKNLIVGDRTGLKMNGNGFILGTTGSGKSQFAKKEILMVAATRPDEDIVIIDPEREYAPLAAATGATTVQISAASQRTVNPMEFDRAAYAEDEGLFRLKAEFVLSMVELLVGGEMGLSARHRSLVDRAARSIYTAFLADPEASQPTLRTLHAELQSYDESQDLATALELYATGSLSGFAEPTNVDTSNRIVVYDIADLGGELKTFGMLVVLEQVWARIVSNRRKGRRTWLYVDEFHLLFSNSYAASYFRSLYQRGRKYGLIPTGITQNIEALLGNADARLMLANSAVLFLLNQTPTDADELVELLSLSPEQAAGFRNVDAGCGVVKMDDVVLPFNDRIPTTGGLYKLFTTKFGESGPR